MFPKNKQKELRQTQKGEIKQENYLNHTTVIKIFFLSPCLFIFRQINLLNLHEKMCLFCFHLPIYS